MRKYVELCVWGCCTWEISADIKSHFLHTLHSSSSLSGCRKFSLSNSMGVSAGFRRVPGGSESFQREVSGVFQRCNKAFKGTILYGISVGLMKRSFKALEGVLQGFRRLSKRFQGLFQWRFNAYLLPRHFRRF